MRKQGRNERMLRKKKKKEKSKKQNCDQGEVQKLRTLAANCKVKCLLRFLDLSKMT